MKTFALIFIVIGTFISNDVQSLPPINFTDTVLTNRMIEALNDALTARDNQQIPPFQLLRQQLQQSFNQQQILDQQQQQQLLLDQQQQQQLLDQQQQQFYPQQFVDQQKQQQQQQQFYLQQSLNQHQPVQQQYLPEQQQFQQPIQQYLPEQQQYQQPIQQHLPEQQVQQHYLPEHQQQQQQPLPSNTDSRGYYYPYPYQNVNWYNFPSLWSAVGGGQLAATAPVAAAAGGHIAPTAPVAAVGVQLNDLGATGGCPTGFCPQGAACTQLSGQWTCGCNTNDCIGIQNPCGIYGQYYFPYYPDPSRFIQCDQTGVFWIRKCAPGTIFDPKISVCNYPPVVVETGKK